MTLEHREDFTHFRPSEDMEEEGLPPEKELETGLKGPSATVPEIPTQQIEEQEVIDDPVHMYLHENGQVRLLTYQDLNT